MKASERLELMGQSETFEELLSNACDVNTEKAGQIKSRIDDLESFFENQGHSRAKPKKMAILYVLVRYGHTPRTVEKWWGEVESSYYSFSDDLGQNYLEEMKDMINDKVGANSDKNWTPGDDVYLSSEDPISEFFDVEEQGYNTKIGSFG